MLILLSPAKTLDFDSAAPLAKSTKPALLKQAQELAELAARLSQAELRSLMNISDNLAEQVHGYFAQWTKKYDSRRAKQAIYAFRGDVYRGFDVDTLDAESVEYAQKHLRILSGLYGVLRPLDLMQAYRLEMGTKLAGSHGRDLYAFWGDSLRATLEKTLGAQDEPILVNLASQEYFRAVQSKRLNCQLITPVFQELHKGEYKVISFLAKLARGAMARYLCENRIDSLAGLRRFRWEGYRFNAELSSEDRPVFTRDRS